MAGLDSKQASGLLYPAVSDMLLYCCIVIRLSALHISQPPNNCYHNNGFSTGL